MNTETSHIFRVISKLVFACFLVVIRSSGAFTVADKPNSLLSYRNKPQFQKAILITQNFERTGVYGNESQSGKTSHSQGVESHFFISSDLIFDNISTRSFSIQTLTAPRGPPLKA